MTYSAAVVGASGFTGGELLRLLDGHPELRTVQATSRSMTNRTVGYAQPNLRYLDLRFSTPDELSDVDVLFAATPHGVSMGRIDDFRAAADLVVDLSADFRLDTEAEYDEWYEGHDRPELLVESVYGLPELNRDALRDANIVATGGCNATATILAHAPLVEAGIVDDDRVVVDLKVGSSEGGAGGGKAASHAERSGVVRPYALTGHRHEAEIEAALDVPVSFTAHAVDMTRGAAATCHAFTDGVAEDEVWGAYRTAYGDEPFVRIVSGGGGVYRYPEPKVVAGTNHAEVGFGLDDDDRIIALAALDNMMKGSAGQAVHAANVALGLEETAGLEFQGLHPVGAP